MTVISVDEAQGLALCADGEVEIALVPPLSPGDRILVHAGTAIAMAA
jgi:hydrogenase maturation factor